jgi:hypothetical protein
MIKAVTIPETAFQFKKATTSVEDTSRLKTKMPPGFRLGGIR